MSAKDDLKEDLTADYGSWARESVEAVMGAIDSWPASDLAGVSVVTALREIAPSVADRLESLPEDEVAEYLRLLKGAGIFTLTLWKVPTSPAPGVDQVLASLDTVG